MIRAILRFFFRAHLSAIEADKTKEVRLLIEDAKRVATPSYVAYDRINPGSHEFIYGFRPLLDNRYLISWINEHKQQTFGHMMNAMRQNDDKKVINGMGQVMLLESMLQDLDTFKDEHDNMEMAKARESEVPQDA